MDQTKLNEIRMLPLLERVLGFRAMILFLVNFYKKITCVLKKLFSTYSKGFSWKIWPTLAKFQKKIKLLDVFTMIPIAKNIK
jgi:hypothetical protein